jgi:hypothetical protein
MGDKEIGVSIESEDTIPAATYEPTAEEKFTDDSDSNDDYEERVNRVLGDKAELSKKRSKEHWLTRYEVLEPSLKSPDPFILAPRTKIPVPVTKENDVEHEVELPHVKESESTESDMQDINLKNLSNPCVKIKEQRCERRANERLQVNLMKPMESTSSKKKS